MCWCWPFGSSNSKKRKPSSSGEKRRRDRPPSEPLYGHGVAVVAEVEEKRRPSQRPQRNSPKPKTSPRSSRGDREEHRARQEHRYYDQYYTREPARPSLNVQVPEMWHRTVDPDDANSSTEMLLNPRPHRSPHERRRHPKRTSQSTLRGRGAKRDPPRGSKSKGNLRQESSRPSAWSIFMAPPPKPARREHRYETYETLDSSPRSHRSSRRHPESRGYQQVVEPSQTQPRHRSRQHQPSSHSAQQTRSRTPNTAARREPDRRFAVLAATNQALEDLRREAFSHPSPPPRRRQRVRNYQGVTVPTSAIPFNWDCVSSSQASGHAP